MRKKFSNTSIVLLSLSVLFLLVGLWSIRTGFDKKNNYYNSEYSYAPNINAYVGGDAYNYIINGTYFAGYCALGGALIISATIAGVAGLAYFFSTEKEDSKQQLEGSTLPIASDDTPQAESHKEGQDGDGTVKCNE